jgi:hypothetical protein
MSIANTETVPTQTAQTSPLPTVSSYSPFTATVNNPETVNIHPSLPEWGRNGNRYDKPNGHICPRIGGCLIDPNDGWCHTHHAFILEPRSRAVVA